MNTSHGVAFGPVPIDDEDEARFHEAMDRTPRTRQQWSIRISGAIPGYMAPSFRMITLSRAAQMTGASSRPEEKILPETAFWKAKG